jgi:hypothetical protein
VTRSRFPESVRTCIGRVAADAEAQIARAPYAEVAADLLEDLDHILQTAAGFRGRECMSEDALAVCSGLHQKVNELTECEGRDSTLWTTDGLRSDPKWAAIRAAAQRALLELDGLGERAWR